MEREKKKRVHLGRILTCFLKEENALEHRAGNNVLMGGFLLQSSSHAAAETTAAEMAEPEWSFPDPAAGVSQR